MSAFNDPAVESNKGSAESFNQWVNVIDDDSLHNLEPFIQADHDLFYTDVGLARDADRHRWTNLVQQHVASWFYGDMSAFLGTWASAVYSTTKMTIDFLSCGNVFALQGLVHCHLEPRIVWDDVPPAAAAVVRHRHVQHFGMCDSSLDGMDEVIMVGSGHPV